MRRIRGKDTAPELLVRRLVARMGYVYQSNRADLPGKPDLVFVRRKRAIFVHGCFWHLHGPCPDSRIPKSRRAYWTNKLSANKRRDARNARQLRAMGWRIMTVWD